MISSTNVVSKYILVGYIRIKYEVSYIKKTAFVFHIHVRFYVLPY